MGDAEIIPLGTRGRPGRGVGRDKPSAPSRSLASGAPRKGAAAETGSPDPAADPTRPPAPGEEQVTRQLPTTGSDHVDDLVDDLDDAFAPVPPASDAEDTGPVAVADATTGTDTSGSAASPVAAAEHPSPAASGDGRPEARRLTAPSLPDLLSAATTAAQRVFGDDADRKLAEMLAFVRRRVTGEYVVDEFGLDAEVIDTFLMEMIRPLATKWFRVEVRGVENIPTDGGALVVANHSGTVPIDGAISMFAVHETTGRNLRPLGADLVFKLPFFGELARKAGATLACNEDATRLLSSGELAAVWPEGFKGIGKPYSERYKLQRFGRGGFVSAAIKTGVPIVPCSIVGAEEIYPLVGNVPALARLIGVPYVPITPFFPLLGPLGMVPLPSKWIIEFGEPIRTDSYEPGAADDPMLVFNLTDQVRETIQQTLYTLLMRRKSVFH
jgi:1-acyl-sn-glycerol-3-phosphate acyltransferase